MKGKWTTAVAALSAVVAVILIWVGVAAQRPRMVKVFRATAMCAAGERLGRRIQLVEIPAEVADDVHHVFPGPEYASYVARTPLAQAIREGDLVRFDHFDTSARSLLFKDVPKGMRLIAIPVQAHQAVGYLIQPGDLVDVLASVVRIDEATRRKDLVATTVLQAVRVRALDTHFMASELEVGNRHYSTVTLEVSPEDAELLVEYQEMATRGFTLVLRPPGDNKRVALMERRLGGR